MCWDNVLPKLPGLVFHHSPSGEMWRYLYLTKEHIGFEQKLTDGNFSFPNISPV